MSDDLTKHFADEASRIEEDTDHSAKGHYNAAEYWGRWHKALGSAATVVSGLAAATALKEAAPAVVAVFSVIAALLSGVMTFLNPSELADRHHRAGDQSLAVRNAARMFRNVELKVAEQSESVARLKQIAMMRDEVLKSAPVIPNRSYSQAKRGIESGESTHAVDKR
ncbi:MAG: SLATT domain-containing protein [Vicinamibacterales bacterium]